MGGLHSSSSRIQHTSWPWLLCCHPSQVSRNSTTWWNSISSTDMPSFSEISLSASHWKQMALVKFQALLLLGQITGTEAGHEGDEDKCWFQGRFQSIRIDLLLEESPLPLTGSTRQIGQQEHKGVALRNRELLQQRLLRSWEIKIIQVNVAD